ncbi:RDD family protein [Nocardia tenerifensis]|uniref:RDD family protein n=1 Tax=Nocardia tenerifensis TaxID=228006 RepID=A0A318K3M6_9NOCA|nr:RDD family protein [Nocardia tenerifensis]PXX66431.1 RDD family protein [Nocardia tenerifensis]
MIVPNEMITPPPAKAHPTTRAAMRKGRIARWLLFLVGVGSLPLTVFFIDLQPRVASKNLATLASLGISLSALVLGIALPIGGTLLWINRRRRKALRRFPWVSWPVRYIATRRYEWVQLLDQHRVPVSTLILSTWPRDIGKLVNHSTSEIWFAGDPNKYGIVSRPGGGDLRYAYRSRFRPAPQFTFRTDETQSNTGLRPEYQLVRERGHTVMKPVDESAVPKRHGGRNDERYPAPRMLRRVLAFLLDWVIHVGCGIGAAVAVSPAFAPDAITRHDWQHVGIKPIVPIGFFLAASAFDRVVIQSIFHTTIGKALFGLVVIRPQDGEYPSFGRLLAVWLLHVYLPYGLLGGPGPDDLENYFLPAVRRRDIRRGGTP